MQNYFIVSILTDASVLREIKKKKRIKIYGANKTNAFLSRSNVYQLRNANLSDSLPRTTGKRTCKEED